MTCDAEKETSWPALEPSRLTADLFRAREAAEHNAEDLLVNATLLHEKGRHPRAAALAVLAYEEFSKAIILSFCHAMPRWDPVIWGGLKAHDLKQGLGSAMQKMVTMIEWTYSQQQFGLLSPLPPSASSLQSIQDEFRQEKKKARLDKIKQRGLYVAVGKNGAPTSIPKRDIGEKESKECLDLASQLKGTVGRIKAATAQHAKNRGSS